MTSFMSILFNFINIYAIFYVLLIGSYAYEHFRIKYLTEYWNNVTNELFLEEIMFILYEYDENIVTYENDEFIEKSRNLHKKNQKLRIELFKAGLKNRFIKYFQIDEHKK